MTIFTGELFKSDSLYIVKTLPGMNRVTVMFSSIQAPLLDHCLCLLNRTSTRRCTTPCSRATRTSACLSSTRPWSGRLARSSARYTDIHLRCMCMHITRSLQDSVSPPPPFFSCWGWMCLSGYSLNAGVVTLVGAPSTVCSRNSCLFFFFFFTTVYVGVHGHASTRGLGLRDVIFLTACLSMRSD